MKKIRLIMGVCLLLAILTQFTSATSTTTSSTTTTTACLNYGSCLTDNGSTGYCYWGACYPIGACVISNDSCIVTNQHDCFTYYSGVFAGAGTTCPSITNFTVNLVAPTDGWMTIGLRPTFRYNVTGGFGGNPYNCTLYVLTTPYNTTHSISNNTNVNSVPTSDLPVGEVTWNVQCNVNDTQETHNSSSRNLIISTTTSTTTTTTSSTTTSFVCPTLVLSDYFDDFSCETNIWDWGYSAGKTLMFAPANVSGFTAHAANLTLLSNVTSAAYADSALDEGALTHHVGTESCASIKLSTSSVSGTMGCWQWDGSQVTPHYAGFWAASNASYSNWSDFRVMIANGSLPVFNRRLAFQNYSQSFTVCVDRYNNSIVFKINNSVVAQWNGTANNNSMKWECWIDNGNVGANGSYSNFSSVNGGPQSMYIDWMNSSSIAVNYGTSTCALSGDYPPCGTVNLREVVDYISVWIDGRATLAEVVRLIVAWART